MILLLDTHFVIWLLGIDDPPKDARKAMGNIGGSRAVSIASIWEIGIKLALGKLTFDRPLAAAVDDLSASGARLLPVTLAHAAHVLPDPPVTRDPFDRMLLAQCDVEGMRLLTVDRALAEHRLAARA